LGSSDILVTVIISHPLLPTKSIIPGDSRARYSQHSALDSDLFNLGHDCRDVLSPDRDSMVTIPLHQPRLGFLTAVVQQTPVHLDPKIAQAMDMDRRQSQQIILIHRQPECPPSQQNSKAVSGPPGTITINIAPPLTCLVTPVSSLLSQQQPRRYPSALTKPQQTHPPPSSARVIVLPHRVRDGRVDGADINLSQVQHVSRAAAGRNNMDGKPGPEGAPTAVDGLDIRAGHRAGEGSVGKDQAERAG
jgi:hypothetical protein